MSREGKGRERKGRERKGKKKEKIDPEIVKIYENKYARYSILGVLIFLVIFSATIIVGIVLGVIIMGRL